MKSKPNPIWPTSFVFAVLQFPSTCHFLKNKYKNVLFKIITIIFVVNSYIKSSHRRAYQNLNILPRLNTKTNGFCLVILIFIKYSFIFKFTSTGSDIYYPTMTLNPLSTPDVQFKK